MVNSEGKPFYNDINDKYDQSDIIHHQSIYTMDKTNSLVKNFIIVILSLLLIMSVSYVFSSCKAVNAEDKKKTHVKNYIVNGTEEFLRGTKLDLPEEMSQVTTWKDRNEEGELVCSGMMAYVDSLGVIHLMFTGDIYYRDQYKNIDWGDIESEEEDPNYYNQQ